MPPPPLVRAARVARPAAARQPRRRPRARRWRTARLSADGADPSRRHGRAPVPFPDAEQPSVGPIDGGHRDRKLIDPPAWRQRRARRRSNAPGGRGRGRRGPATSSRAATAGMRYGIEGDLRACGDLHRQAPRNRRGRRESRRALIRRQRRGGRVVGRAGPRLRAGVPGGARCRGDRRSRAVAPTDVRVKRVHATGRGVRRSSAGRRA